MKTARFLALHAAAVGCILSLTQRVSAERVVLVAGGGSDTNTSMPIKAERARLSAPFGVDFDRNGNLYLVEMTGQRVRKLDKSGMLSIVAGTGEQGMVDGPGLRAQFNGIHNLAVNGDGDLLLADTWNNCVRLLRVAANTVERTIGTGEKGFTGDNSPAASARFGGIYCVSVGGDQQIYLADLDNLRIRAVNPKTGLVRTVAGNGRKGVPNDGTKATEAPLVDPRAVIADEKGRVYVLERSGHALRVVSPDGGIKTVVGTGQKGNTGDGGDARQATLNGPKHLCFDLNGDLIIADTENHVIRRYSPKDGRIVRLAGSGVKGNEGIGGSALQVELNQPHGVYVHKDGSLYISDSSNHRVLRVEK